jgi:hypothetical protein
MENTNTAPAATIAKPVTKARRTYLLAGIPCLCWDGALFAPLSGVSANLGQVTVGPGADANTVTVTGTAGEETWHMESRDSIKSRGTAARKPKPKAAAPAPAADEEPSALADAIAAVKERSERRSA